MGFACGNKVTGHFETLNTRAEAQFDSVLCLRASSPNPAQFSRGEGSPVPTKACVKKDPSLRLESGHARDDGTREEVQTEPPPDFSAGELIAGDLQPTQIAERGHGHRLRLKELPSQALKVFRGHGFDLLDQFIEVLEAVEVHFLAG
jgi:hypothetical protein